MPNRKIAPPIIDAVNFDLFLPPFEKNILRNGVEVYSVNAGTEEVLALEWVFFAGNNYEQNNMIAAATNALIKNGTSVKTAFQINEFFDYYGAYLNRGCYNETASISLHCLNKHVAELLPVVKEVLTDARFPQEELDIYKQNSLQRLAVNLQKTDFIANRLIDTYLFGEEHPYGKYSREEDIAALHVDALRSFYDQYYKNGRFILFVAGKIPANLMSLLDDIFGNLPNVLPPQPLLTTAPATEKKYTIAHSTPTVQASLRLARPFPNRHHPDFVKALVVNTLLGGFFGSRLMENIREDKGYTYGIHSFIQNHLQESAWIITTEVGKDVAEAAVNETYKEMKRLQEEQVDEEELLLVKNYLLGSILGDLEGPFQIIGRWKNTILHGLPLNQFEISVNAIKNITAQEVQEIAQKYLNPADFYELTVS